MKIYFLDEGGRLSHQELQEVVAFMNKGGVVVIPTDTSYGLAALINNKKGLRRVFALKNRPKEKASPIAVRDMKQAVKYAELSTKIKRLWKAFLPGPLSIVTQAKGERNPYIHRPDNSIAIRNVPTPVIKQLLTTLDVPITITSANVAGQKDVYSLKEYKKQYKSGIMADAFIHAGRLARRKPSTSVKFDNGDYEIKRVGVISKKRIDGVLK